ncbi:MAG: DUF2190 family protein [Planctomycetota bacterium]
MKNHKGSADRLTITAPVDMDAGQLYALKSLVCVPVASALAGEKVAVVTRGEFDLRKSVGVAATTGDQAFRDPASGEVTPDDGADHVLIGVFTADVADAATLASVALTGQVAQLTGVSEPPAAT